MNQEILDVLKDINKNIDSIGFSEHEVGTKGTTEKIAMELAQMNETMSDIATSLHNINECLFTLSNK